MYVSYPVATADGPTGRRQIDRLCRPAVEHNVEFLLRDAPGKSPFPAKINEGQTTF
jgi:hypothetical protein